MGHADAELLPRQAAAEYASWNSFFNNSGNQLKDFVTVGHSVQLIVKAQVVNAYFHVRQLISPALGNGFLHVSQEGSSVKHVQLRIHVSPPLSFTVKYCVVQGDAGN